MLPDLRNCLSPPLHYPRGQIPDSVRDAAMGSFRFSGMSYRKLSRLFDCDPKTVKRRLEPIELFFSPYASPLLLTQREHPGLLEKEIVKHFIVYAIMEDPTRSVRDIEHMMKYRNFHFAVKKSCISNYLAQMKITVAETIKRPLLTPKHKENREHFAEGIEEDERYNLPWLFTDESSIDLNPTRKTAYRIPGIQIQENVYQNYTKHPIRIMVWGGIARDYKTPLILVKGIINAEKYMQMLEEHRVIENLDTIHGLHGWVFQDDGARPHRARLTKEWLNQRCLNLTGGELTWPANSPDLNPIEQLWAILKQSINRDVCTTAAELFTQAQQAWDAISIEVINSLIDSFPTRLRAVQALKGQSLNGRRDVLNNIKNGVRSIEEIITAHLDESEMIKSFMIASERLFGDQGAAARMNIIELSMHSKWAWNILPYNARMKMSTA
jgi:hypothetical protein